MVRIGFFASQNATAARAITAACHSGVLKAQPALLITNNPNAPAISWAEHANIIPYIINAKTHDDPDSAISDILKKSDITLGVCTGYMKLIGSKTLHALPMIINSHPALLPKYGGQGMYGFSVHKAVHSAQEKETGITIHQVDAIYDHGRIIAQKTIPLTGSESAEDIERIVKAAESPFYIETLQKILSAPYT